MISWALAERVRPLVVAFTIDVIIIAFILEEMLKNIVARYVESLMFDHNGLLYGNIIW